jgi:hypothetical protein
MARKVILETNYVFNPSAKTVTLGRFIKQERLALITNVSKNIVIYNFSDPNLKSTSYTALPDTNVQAVGGGIGISSLQVISPASIAVGQAVKGNNIVAGTYVTSVTGSNGSYTIGLSNAMTGNAFDQYTFSGTVITLNYNTALMALTDKLQIVIDEYDEKFTPSETFLDPVSKMRTSTPQSLIDADFEYGLQPTKWEVLQMVNNRPSFFVNNQTPLPLLDITATNGSKSAVIYIGTAGTGTIVTTTSSTTVTGTNTNFNQFTTPVGTVLYGTTTNSAGTTVPGTLIGTVQTINSTSQLTLTQNAFVAVSGNFFYTPGGFNITGAVPSGTVSAVYTGTIVSATNSATVTGVNTNFTLLQTGYSLYTVSGAFIGTVSSTPNNTTLTLLSNAAQTVSGALYIVSNVGAGAPIMLQDTNYIPSNQGLVIDSTSATNPTQLNYTIPTAYSGTTGSILNAPLTLGFLGQFYTGGALPNLSLSAPAPFTGTTFTVSGSTVTGNTSGAHNFAVGTPIQVTGTTASTNAPNGNWVVATVPSSNSFTFTANPAPTGAIGNGTVGSTLITATTTSVHGLVVNDPIMVINSVASSGAPNGSWVVNSVPTATTLTFVANNYVGSGTITNSGQMYVRPVGLFSHRAFDGGVQMSTVSNAQGLQLIRQTRRVFRYQSGKGIQFSTGSVLKPELELDSITSSGTTCTVTTKIPHSLATGATVFISNSTVASYNGTFVVTSVPSSTTFTYTASSTPSVSPAPGIPVGNVVNWYGAVARLGMFDNQNGFFWEYNGQILNVVRRSSVDKLSGRVQVTNGSATVTGVNTLFASQLIPGDFVVIRGQSYRITAIASNTSMTISPEYRGTTIGGVGSAIIMKTVEYRVPQSNFNIDTLDGNGGSGYNIDLSKMQMFYADYAWYGAGAIRYGVKDQYGNVMYCHKITHANVKPKAYMRSGNLPARYEISTIPLYTYLTSIVQSSDTTLNVNDTSGFPTAGTVLVEQEYISYTGKTQTSLTGCTRGVTGGAAASVHQIATYPISVFLIAQNYAPVISHWGSAVIMDGRFDDDKGYLFSASNPTPISVTNAQTNAVISLRLAPAVDNGQVDLLGNREIINRAQLLLREMDVYANGTFYVQLKINSYVSAGTWQNVGGSSLSQVCYHPTGTTVSGGETVYAFYANASGGSTTFTTTQVQFPTLRDLGNSILGGGTSNSVAITGSSLGFYPDGPDILTVVVTNVGSSSANIYSRFSWGEAQA